MERFPVWGVGPNYVILLVEKLQVKIAKINGRPKVLERILVSGENYDPKKLRIPDELYPLLIRQAAAILASREEQTTPT